MKNSIYRIVIFVFIHSSLHAAMEVTYTQTDVGDDWHSEETRIEIILKGPIEIEKGRELPIATIASQPVAAIVNMVIVLQPTTGFIVWQWEDGKNATIRMNSEDARVFFYMLVKNHLEMAQDVNISKFAESTPANITYHTNIIKIDHNVYQRTQTVTIAPFEQGPVWIKYAYNQLIEAISGSLYIREIPNADIPIIFTQIPIWGGETIKQYIREIPTRIKYFLGLI